MLAKEELDARVSLALASRTSAEPAVLTADLPAEPTVAPPPFRSRRRLALGPLIEVGLVATCGVIEFALGWATRTARKFDDVRADRQAGSEWLATHDKDWRRALDIQAALWRAGLIRGVGVSDVLVAAVAERAHVTILHYDSDYDLIARTTGQPAQWVVREAPRPTA
jgi:predicted nucleic acid-binding protein